MAQKDMRFLTCARIPRDGIPKEVSLVVPGGHTVARVSRRVAGKGRLSALVQQPADAGNLVQVL